MVAMVVILTVALVMLGGVVGWQRYTIRRLMLERVKNAESLLLGTVEVDGHVFPSPTDDRWVSAGTVRLDSGTTTAVLSCGSVRITETGNVFIVGNTSIPSSVKMHAWVKDVWREHRNRLVKKELA